MIEAKELTMYYGDFLAVDKASFTIGTGEIVGLLGPNGAGKTTIMKMLTTYLHPTSGTALVGGKDILTQALEVRTVIGYLPESLPLYPGMEVRDYLAFVGRARGLTGDTLQKRMEYVRERCGLKQVYRQPISELSKGYKQRTGLAQALIHDPSIVILDEPTSGLDPHQIIEIRTLIAELAKERTVVISTHILQEMAALSERFLIIDRGRIVADGPLGALRDRVMKQARLHFTVGAAAPEVEPELKKITSITGMTPLNARENTSSFELLYKKGVNLVDELNKVSAEKKWQLFELKEHPYSLEETFLTLTRPESAALPAAAVEGAAS